MTNWNDLPYEIHIIILTKFCHAIIDDFTWDEAKWNQHADKLKEILNNERYEWPKTPQPLVDYRSALQTSRYFYDLLSNDIKSIRFGPSEALISLQDELFFKVLCRYSTDIRVMYYVAGCFWKNPDIIKYKPCTLRDTIESLSPQSRQMLLAHAQPWMDQLAESISKGEMAIEHYRSLCWRWM